MMNCSNGAIIKPLWIDERIQQRFGVLAERHPATAAWMIVFGEMADEYEAELTRLRARVDELETDLMNALTSEADCLAADMEGASKEAI